MWKPVRGTVSTSVATWTAPGRTIHEGRMPAEDPARHPQKRQTRSCIHELRVDFARTMQLAASIEVSTHAVRSLQAQIQHHEPDNGRYNGPHNGSHNKPHILTFESRTRSSNQTISFGLVPSDLTCWSESEVSFPQ